MGKDKHSKKSPTQDKLQNTASVAAVKQPDWPPFKPSLPVLELEFGTPAPGLEDQIVIIRNFWPKSLCQNYVSFLKGLPLTTTPGRPKRGEAVRVNDRFQVDDPRFAKRLWLETGLKDAVLQESVEDLWGGDVVGLNGNIRVYRYTRGHFFDAHYDDSNLVTLTDDQNPSCVVSAKTTWTALLYLTSSAEGCVGGETVFYPHDRKATKEGVAIAPDTGMLLLHKHGEDCLLYKFVAAGMLILPQHEGREVTQGEKWILRTDLCVRR